MTRSGETSPDTRPRAVVIEDESVFAMELEVRLTDLGFRVVGVAGDGMQGLILARELRPDVVLCDVVMPGVVGGIDAATLIVRLGIPVVFITAHRDQVTLDRITGAGASACLHKPLAGEALTLALEAVLSGLPRPGNDVPKDQT